MWGDSDTWVKKILKDVDTKKTHVVKLVDLVSTVEEEIVEGMEDEDEHEHDHDHDHSKNLRSRSRPRPTTMITTINMTTITGRMRISMTMTKKEFPKLTRLFE